MQTLSLPLFSNNLLVIWFVLILMGLFVSTLLVSSKSEPQDKLVLTKKLTKSFLYHSSLIRVYQHPCVLKAVRLIQPHKGMNLQFASTPPMSIQPETARLDHSGGAEGKSTT